MKDNDARGKIRSLELDLEVLRSRVGDARFFYTSNNYGGFYGPPEKPVTNVLEEIDGKLKALLDYMNLEVEKVKPKSGYVVKGKGDE